MFNIRFGKIKFGFWRVTFLESFVFIFTTWKLCDGRGSCAVDALSRAHWGETEFIVTQHVLKIPEVPVYQWYGTKQSNL